MKFPVSKVKDYEVETLRLIFIISHPKMILMLFVCGPHF